MKPVDVKFSIYNRRQCKNRKKTPKFKVADLVRTSKFKNIFAKCYDLNWSKEIFIIKKVKNTVQWTHVISDLNGKEIVRTFYEKELQKYK